MLHESTETVVVGGGVIGASIALHLLQEGMRDVVLVERDNLAQATSSAGAGFVGLWAAGAIDGLGEEELAIEQYALDFYRELTEMGHETGFRQDGCLWIAVNERPLEFIARIARHQDARFVEPREIEDLTGVVPAHGITRGVLQTTNAQVSARLATLAIAAEFAARGGRTHVHRPVSRVVVENGRVRGVETLQGRIDTDTVVLAAGAWTNELLREHCIFAPMAPLVASRIVTEPMGVPNTMPTLYLLGFATAGKDSMWIREEQGGLLYGTGYQATPHELFVDAELPERFDQLPMDGICELERIGAAASKALPLLARYRSYTIAHGVPCFTIDARGLVGEVPGIEGLYLAGGCNETGITHAPGWGRALAELIVQGRSVIADVSVWRIDRFGERYTTARSVLDNRAPWRQNWSETTKAAS